MPLVLPTVSAVPGAIGTTWSPWRLVESYRGWSIYSQYMNPPTGASRSWMGATVFAVRSPGDMQSELVNTQVTMMAGGLSSPTTLAAARKLVDMYIADAAAAKTRQGITQWHGLPTTGLTTTMPIAPVIPPAPAPIAAPVAPTSGVGGVLALGTIIGLGFVWLKGN